MLLCAACTPSRATLLAEIRATNATIAKLAAQLDAQEAALDEQAAELALLRKDMSALRADGTPPTEPPAPEEDPHIHCPNPSVCVIDQVRWDELLKDPSSLARQCRLVPLQEDGRTRGFKIFGIRQGSLPRALGLQNGDTLTHVNEIRLGSADEVVKLAADLLHTKTLILTFERRGETMNRRIEIR